MTEKCETGLSEVAVELINGDMNSGRDPLKTNFGEGRKKTFKKQETFLNYGQEDQMVILGYKRRPTFVFITWFFSIVTCGILPLIFFWKPSLKLKFMYKGTSLVHADVVYLKDQYGNTFVEKVKEVERLPRVVNELQVRPEGDPIELVSPLKQLMGSLLQATRYFENKKVKYLWCEHEAIFTKLRGLEEETLCSDLHEMGGLSSSDQSEMRSLFGVNLIDVPLTPYWKLLLTEALDPLYIFQLFSVVLWFCDNYVYFASIILFISIVILAQSVFEIRSNQKMLKRKVHPSKDVLVYKRDANCSELRSSETLVPGDLLEIPKRGCVMQCDAVLISGDCIVNESMLTGESVPVTKTPLPSFNCPFSLSQHSRHTLFSGTEVIQTRYYDQYKVYAVVLRTGFSTTKGELVRSIMFPKPMDLRFSRDVSRFILFLFLIASVGMLYTFVVMALRGDEVWHMVVRALDLVTIVIPPTLPAALTTCVRLAEGRLKRKRIYCLSLRSLNMCGVVEVFCFDKTGTLTEEGLDFKCLLPCTASVPSNVPVSSPLSSSALLSAPSKKPNSSPVESPHSTSFGGEVKEVAAVMGETEHVVVAMASCHSINIVDGDLMGDPLDLKMFEASNWQFEKETQYDDIVPTIIKPPFDSSQGTIQVGVVRVFPFSSHLQRMSVITKRLDVDNRYDCYVKGSPEMVISFCKKHTVPSDFHQVLTSYAQLGYRVIALAYKPCKKSYLKIQHLKREAVEKDLSLLGLLVFENRLKPQSTPIIKLLNNAHIRTLMVTGDNIQTALSVARKCAMIGKGDHAILVSAKQLHSPMHQPSVPHSPTHHSPTHHSPTHHSPTHHSASSSTPSSDKTSRPPPPPPPLLQHALKAPIDATIKRDGDDDDEDDDKDLEFTLCEEAKKEADLELAGDGGRCHYVVEGKTWALVRKKYPLMLQKLARQGTVFARFLPEQKQQLVETLQEDGKFVGMCGDGANDCGALKTAHTGISLSEAEASVASPFTSNEPNITCVVKIIREGRAALVSSSGNFRFLAGYSLTQFMSICILYWVGASFTDFIFLYIDLVLIFTLSYTFNRTGAYKHLSHKAPSIALLTPSTVVSILLQLSLNTAFQVSVWILTTHQPWFVPFVDNAEDKYQCHEVTSVFLLSSFQYIILAVVFSKGAPYRKSIFTNGWFLASIVSGTLIGIYFTFYPSTWIIWLLELSPPATMEFRLLIVVMAFLNLILNFLVEFVLIERLSRVSCKDMWTWSAWLSWCVGKRKKRNLDEVTSDVTFLQPALQPSTLSDISHFSSSTTRAIDADNLPLIDDPNTPHKPLHNQTHNQVNNQTHNQSYIQPHNQSYIQPHNQSYIQPHNQTHSTNHHKECQLPLLNVISNNLSSLDFTQKDKDLAQAISPSREEETSLLRTPST